MAQERDYVSPNTDMLINRIRIIKLNMPIRLHQIRTQKSTFNKVLQMILICVDRFVTIWLLSRK